MAQSIQYDRYPKFVADQVLTEKSLNQMFGYLEEQERLTRTTLIGIGVMCGMKVKISPNGTSLTITHGVGVTSKGFLVPFPETTYTFYNDEFSAEQEIKYGPFLDAVGKQKFPLYLLHNNGAAEIKKPINLDFLEDKAVVIFVELLKVDNINCDPDSCDDKGCTIEVTHRPLLVDLENLNALIYGSSDEVSQSNEPSCIEWPEFKLPRYNVPSTYILSSETVLKNFLDLLNEDFILSIENVLKASYNALGYYIEDEYPNNPFSGLKNKFAFLFDGSISTQQLLYIQYYYDFFSDLILAYEELRHMCNECLAVCCPNEKLFPRHLILGNAIPSVDEFRHHWIPSPAFSCNCCSEGKTRFLLKKLVLLVEKLDIPKTIFSNTNVPITVKITPSQYGNLPLSNKAIPYYYDVTKVPNELYNNWNYNKTKLKKGDTNLSYYASSYNNESYIKDPLSYDIEPFNFFRVEGHLGKNWKTAIGDIIKIKNEKRLPIDVVALNGDILELIRSLYSNSNSLSEVIAENPGARGELQCYFSDLEGQYDVQAAELRCTILKVMVYFYNLRIAGRDGFEPSTNFPQSDLIRKAFPTYTTYTNTYGQRFDEFYVNVKNQPYITPAAFFASTPVGSTNGGNSLLDPIYLMYYLEKIHESLVEGLIDLKINDLSQRLYDAVYVASVMLTAFDSNPDFQLPAFYEESLDAVIRICKAEVFRVIYRNYLINYILFISNQSFAMYAFNNSGIQHKAGVTNGGTFVIVYRDKRDERILNFAGPSDFVANVNTENSTNNAATNNASGSTNNMAGGVFTAFAGSNSTVNNASERIANTNNDFIGVSHTQGYTNRNINISSHMKNVNSIKGIGMRNVLDLTNSITSDDKLSDQELKVLVDQFPDGTVIADFFVPNMCKAACMSMNFIVLGGDNGEEPTEVVLKIENKDYCERDSENYPITATPEGGILKINGVVANEHVFNPSSINIGNVQSKEITISYEFNGVIKTIIVKVFKKPKAAFTIVSVNNANHSVSLKNESLFAEKYLWNFGDGQTSTLKEPDIHIYSATIQTAVITLTVFNGPCEDKSQPFTINFQQPTVNLQIENREYCGNDTQSYPIIATPAGGVLQINGVVVTANFFLPGSINIGNSLFKEVTISYTFNGVTKSLIVKVFKKPTAAFSIVRIDPSSHTVSLKNESLFAENFLWDFGDGQTSDLEDPEIHTYSPNIQTAVITLTALNGPCTDRTQPVTISFEQLNVERTCLPVSQLSALFKSLDEVSTTLFISNIGIYGLLKSIFTVKIDQILLLSQKDQFNLLVADLTPAKIQDTLKVLNSLILSNPELRRLAVTLYKILMELTMFYACCQQKDIDKADIQTKALFDDMIRNMTTWLRGQIIFSSIEKNIIKSMKLVIVNELNKAITDTPNKIQYIDVLKVIDRLLDKILA